LANSAGHDKKRCPRLSLLFVLIRRAVSAGPHFSR
jgi:hypothetical protein